VENRYNPVSKLKTICFVTNELYPLHKGGIGRLMYNFARHNAVLRTDVAFHILVPSRFPENMSDVTAAFKGLATIHRCAPLGQRPEELARLAAAGPAKGWEFRDLYMQSLEYFYGLLDIERRLGAPLGIAEFPDFGGWAMASVAAKRSGLAFRDTVLSVRLHSSQGLISRYEKYYHYPSRWLGAFLDAERELLTHADRVVGHVPSIAARNASHYGFSAAWRENVVIEFPLIEVDAEREVVDEPDAGDAEHPDFIFSSRLQPFKRPDLFVKAAIMLLDNRPQYRGIFRIASYGWDQSYIQSLKDLVPPSYAERIVFLEQLSSKARQVFLRRSVVVVPSDYESLCLFAFEASQIGRPVILNRACEAFGAFDRWVEGENCLMFDGTATDLARTMMAAVGWSPSAKVSVAPDVPYWVNAAPPGGRTREEDLPATVLVCHGFTDPADVSKTLLSLRSLGGLDQIGLVFFLPAATMGPRSATAKMLSESGIAIRYLSGFGQSSDELAQALLKLECDVAILLPPPYQIHPHFLRAVRQTLADQPSVGIVSTHVRYLDRRSKAPMRVELFAGDMPSVALTDDMVAPPVFALRLSLLKAMPFDDRAGASWKEAWLREAVGNGVEVVILPSIGIDVAEGTRRPPNSVALTGSIVDAVGLRHGLSARLIAIEPRDLPDGRRTFEEEDMSGDALRGAVQLWPQDRAHRDYPLVGFRADLGGLLVHPIDETAVAAWVRGPRGAIRLIEAETFNVNSQNLGIEVAIGLCAEEALNGDLARAFSLGRVSEPNLISDWMRVGPGEVCRVSLRNIGAARDRNIVVLLSRVPRGGSEAYCHLIYKSVRCHFLPKDWNSQ